MSRVEAKARPRHPSLSPAPRPHVARSRARVQVETSHTLFICRDGITAARFPRAFLFRLLSPAWASFLSVPVDPPTGTHHAPRVPTSPRPSLSGEEPVYAQTQGPRCPPSPSSPRQRGRGISRPSRHCLPGGPGTFLIMSRGPAPTSASWGHLPAKLLTSSRGGVLLRGPKRRQSPEACTGASEPLLGGQVRPNTRLCK